MTNEPERNIDLEEALIQLNETREALRLSELRAHTLAHLISDYGYVYCILPDGHIEYEWVADSFKDISGYTNTELIALGWMTLIDPADQAEVEARNRAVKAGQADIRTWRVHLKDGRVRWVHDSCQPIQDKIDGSIRVYGAAQDITERYEAEQEASQQHRFLAAIFEAITDAVGVYDPQGQLLLSNTAMTALLAVNGIPQTLSLPEWRDLSHVQDEHSQQLAFEQMPLASVLGGDVLTGERAAELRIHPSPQQVMQLSVSGGPIYDDQQKLAGAVLVLRDVTARREKERRTTRALEVLLEMAGVMVQFSSSTLHTADETSYLKNASLGLLDWTRELLVCRTAGLLSLQEGAQQLELISMVGLEETIREPFWREFSAICLAVYTSAVSQGQALYQGATLIDLMQLPESSLLSYGIQYVLIAPIRIGERLIGTLALDYDSIQHTFPLEQEGALLQGIARLAALAIERERMLQERINAQAEEMALHEANRQMDEFLSMASHELRSPLTAIKAGLQMIGRLFRRRAQELPLPELLGRAEEMLERAERQIAVEVRLVDDLLDVSRIQSNKLELHVRELNLYELVRGVVADQQASVEQRKFVLDLPVIESLMIKADGDRIGQVLNNFLTNALKYSPEGTPIVVRLELLERDVRVSVRDQGVGLSTEQQQRIWERFYQVTTRKSGGQIGLGLGLHISKSIIQQQKGSIGVESTPGCGSTFWFTLPLLTD